ncbi:MAG: acyl-CoA dehydrogenase family protein [Thiohalomonadaceae bacterium]
MLKRVFTEEQTMFRQAYREFLNREIVPYMENWREKGVVDRKAFLKAGEQGFLMVWPDEEFGGIGDTDFRYEQIIIEENAWAMTLDWFQTLHSRLVGPYIHRFGNRDQQLRFIPKCVKGEIILAIAMTEPGAGSDLRGMRATAIDRGSYYLLNGSKTYISNGLNADVIIVAAKTDPINNPNSIGLFIVERGMEGLSRGACLKKLGFKAQDTTELFFDNIKVPKENVLGDPSKGMSYLMEGLAEERLIAGVKSLSMAQKAMDLTVSFVKERDVFGKKLSEFQNTQFSLASLQAEMESLQVYLDRCVIAHNEKNLTGVDAAKLKLLCSEFLGRVVDECLQLHGGAGYMDEYPICRLYADARVTRIYAGTSEVMKMIISRDTLGRERANFIDRDLVVSDD